MLATQQSGTPAVQRPSRATRLAAFLFLVVLLLGGIVLYRHNPVTATWMPPCPLFVFTGLYCPGCGSGRATHQLLHGHLVAAWLLNPLYLLALPYLLYSITREVLGWLTGVRLPLWHLSGRVAWWWIPIIVGLYGLLRNIPVYPFTLLAPHGPGAG